MKLLSSAEVSYNLKYLKKSHSPSSPTVPKTWRRTAHAPAGLFCHFIVYRIFMIFMTLTYDSTNLWYGTPSHPVVWVYYYDNCIYSHQYCMITTYSRSLLCIYITGQYRTVSYEYSIIIEVYSRMVELAVGRRGEKLGCPECTRVIIKLVTPLIFDLTPRADIRSPMQFFGQWPSGHRKRHLHRHGLKSVHGVFSSGKGSDRYDRTWPA